MSKETRQIRKARTYAHRAARISREESMFGDTTRYITAREFMNIGNAVMNINNALEKSPQKLRIKQTAPEKTQMLEQDLMNASDAEAAYRAIEYALAEDPLNPTLHFFAGQFFTDSSVRDESEERNMPAYRNIIALASFATVSRLQPNLTEAHQGMERALSLIDITKDVEKTNNSELEKLIKGDMLIKQRKFQKGIQLLGTVKPESAYAWLALVRIAEAFLEDKNQDAAATAATSAGKILTSMKDYQMAVPLYEFSAGVRQDPQSYLMLGEAYASAGLLDEAEKSFMNASGAIPKTYEDQLIQVEAKYKRRQIVWERGSILWENGEISEANELFLESTALFQEARAFEHAVRKQRSKK